jgi:F-type H+-transporting ATPase subunit b
MTALAFAESIQLVPDGTLFLHIAIILLMVFLLNRMLFRPLGQVLAERESHTRGRTGEAHETVRRAEESLTRYELALREARTEGYQLLEKQQTEAAEERRRKLGQVRAEVEGAVAEQKRVIMEQSEAARLNLEAEARRAAATISAQVLRRPVQ